MDEALRKIKYSKWRDKNILNKRSKKSKILFGIVFGIMFIYALTLTFPFVWMWLSSLKGSLEYSGGNAFALPKKWLFSNYIKAFEMLTLDDGTTFLGMIFNSIWYTGIATILNVFVSAVSGYCLSKYNFKGRNLIYAIAIFCMTIPIVGSMGAYFKLVSDLGIYDTPLYVIVANLSSWGFNFLIMYGFFKNVSWSYAEATFIDGGNHYTVFFKVMLPQARGALITLAIMSIIGNWNDYMTMILYLPSYPTLASGLYSFQAIAIRNVNYPVYFAGLVISVIPIIILFTVFSDVMMQNMSVGGLKG